MYRFKILILFLIIPLAGLFSQSRQFQLSLADISSDNHILVAAENPLTGGYSYKTLILGNAETLEYGPLTLFPEESGYFPARRELRVHNHYGMFSYDLDNKSWQRADFLPSFKQGVSISPLTLLPVYDSPDGKYSLYLKEEEGVRVSLYLYDHDRSKSILVTGSVPRDFSSEMAKWSPDSRYFVYRRNRDLYYFSIEQYMSGRIPAEDFRTLGHEYMNSVCWGQGNYLYLISDNLIYRLHSSEFFTRSFYADPFHKGSVWGRIPIHYDPLFDGFAINPSGTDIFVDKDDRHGFVFALNQIYEEKESVRQSGTLSLPAGQVLSDYTWVDNHRVLTMARDRLKKSGVLYQMDRRESTAFSPVTADEINAFALSPDNSQIALLSREHLTIVDSSFKEELNTYKLDSPRKVYWIDEGLLILGGHVLSRQEEGKSEIIGLSQVDAYAFDADNRVVVVSSGESFTYNRDFSWEKTEDKSLRPHRQSTDDYRIYLEDRPEGWYAQSLKVRKNDSYTTDDLLQPFRITGLDELLPQNLRNQEDIPWYFSHGNRQGRRQVSLVINAVNSAEGLNRLMETLDGYGIRAAFFLNGDFINNYPDGTRLIAESGHTVGSLFYTYFDMSDPKYQINRDFLKKGLARNEDDYFIVTGKEMAMLWHAPYYYLNREILETTGILDYTYVGKEMEIPDWIGKGSAENGRSGYAESLELIDRILDQVTPGAIIPLTLGRFAERDDYLYMKLGMLIEGLILEGYEIVPLYNLME